MKQCLADVNVWLALLVRFHEHHGLTRRWFDALAPGEAGLCRIVQLALIRLASPAILGERALSAAAAWELVEELLQDERVYFQPEPPQIDSVLPDLLRYCMPTGKLVADAYLAAFAMTGSLRLVTLDRGFRQFRGLDVTVLG